MDTRNSEEAADSDVAEATATASQPAATGATKKKSKQPATTTAENPCLCCSENCKKSQAAVRCVMCALWAHKTCLKMTDAVFKNLDQQFKETGTAYWVCRPCQSFAQRIQNQFTENNKRHEATERKVEENTKGIGDNKKEINDLRNELRKLAEKVDKNKEAGNNAVYDEMQERESRRANIVLHNIDEIPENVRGNSARVEKDKERCEQVFEVMRARTRKEDIRFCRRLGEPGDNQRPIVIGLETEEEKRHILSKAKNLQGTKFNHITVVQDLTKVQREKEDKLRNQAKEKNRELSEEDLINNMKWLVVGRRGERRIIKGIDRREEYYEENNEYGGARGGQRRHSNADRGGAALLRPYRTYSDSWVPARNNEDSADSRGYQKNAGLRGGDEWWNNGRGSNDNSNEGAWTEVVRGRGRGRGNARGYNERRNEYSSEYGRRGSMDSRGRRNNGNEYEREFTRRGSEGSNSWRGGGNGNRNEHTWRDQDYDRGRRGSTNSSEFTRGEQEEREQNEGWNQENYREREQGQQDTGSRNVWTNSDSDGNQRNKRGRSVEASEEEPLERRSRH